MKAYKATIKFKNYYSGIIEVEREIIVLSDEDSREEFIQMGYGGFAEVLDVEFEEVKVVVSKNFIKERMKKHIEKL
jgi:hypothetical protein